MKVFNDEGMWAVPPRCCPNETYLQSKARIHGTHGTQRQRSVYLWLHHGCNLVGAENKKLFRQYPGFHKIIERIRSLANRLKLPQRFKINPVTSIAQLTPVYTAWAADKSAC
ncbi:uncharacterized protein BJX67DRAFT_364416 [Aspergillus lucknowensis]|uniref:Uncharacterized protein n=1 Tax=Aspergillus lucknowensis TaxID=176173 RepID=A0ABR4LF63_9EURO